MKNFNRYYEEEVRQQVKGWGQVLKDNPSLQNAIKLLGEIEKLQPGSEALITGGTVRDLVLNTQPHDIDITTNVPIDTISQHFKTHDIGKSKDFGILSVKYGDEYYEVSNYREEGKYSDFRRPDDVKMTSTFEKDSTRRDFTINAMGLNKFGEIVDYHGGLDDIKNKIIKTVGEPQERLMEDALRLLRISRFSATLGFKVENKTEQVMKELGYLIDHISVERVTEELFKAAKTGQSLANYILHLDKVGILERVIPEFTKMRGLVQNLERHPEGEDTPYGAGSVLGHIIECLKASKSNDPLTNVAILLHDVGKGVTYVNKKGKHTYYGHEKAGSEMLDAIAKRLHFSSNDTQAMKFAASKHMVVHNLTQLKKSKIINLVNDPNWELLVDVAYADEASRGPNSFDPKEFEKKINWAEGIVDDLNQGAGSGGLKQRIKQYIDGNKLLEWIPELSEPNNEPYIGQLLKQASDWLISNDFKLPSSTTEVTEQDVKDYVSTAFDNIQNAGTFNQYWQNDET